MLTAALSRNWQVVFLGEGCRYGTDYAEDRRQENNSDILIAD